MRSAGPTCRHFGPCGGCSSLDVPIATQVARKCAEVQRLAGTWLAGVPVEHEVPPTARVHSRTKLLYPLQADPEGRIVGGIYARGSHEIVPISECAIQDEGLTTLATRVLEVLRGADLPAYDETAGTGFLRAIQLRLAPGTGQVLLGIVTTGGLFPRAAELVASIRAVAEPIADSEGRALRLVGIVRNLNDTRGNALLGPRSVPLHGQDHLVDRAAGLDFRISFASFAQTHRAADTLLYDTALGFVGDVRGLTVVDGYGGIGAFGLRLAKRGAHRVRIVEAARSSCADAEHNAKRNRLPLVSVVAEPFATFRSHEPTDLLVVDPPRAGLLPEGAAAALALRAPRILHVACSLPALARDLERLCAGGYRVMRCHLADLFPFTEHAEVLTLLERC